MMFPWRIFPIGYPMAHYMACPMHIAMGNGANVPIHYGVHHAVSHDTPHETDGPIRGVSHRHPFHVAPHMEYPVVCVVYSVSIRHPVSRPMVYPMCNTVGQTLPWCLVFNNDAVGLPLVVFVLVFSLPIHDWTNLRSPNTRALSI